MRRRENSSGEFVLVIGGLPDILPGFNAWQPVKDLIRKIINKSPAGVNMFETPGGGSKIAFCSIKHEADADLAFRSIAGNTWHGSLLTVALFKYAGRNEQLLYTSNTSFSPQRRQLELISPIVNDGHSSTPTTSYHPIVSQNLMMQPFSGPAMAGISQGYGQFRAHNQPPDGPYVLPAPSSETYVHPGSAYNVPNQSIGPSQGSPWPGLFFGSNAYRSATEQQLRDQALQAFRVYQPGQDGQMWGSPIGYGPTTWSGPPAVYPTGYGPPHSAQTTAIPVCPVIPLQPYAVPSSTFHENANGTLVNVSQGAVTTEDRGIVVHNLNYGANQSDVEAYFKPAGEIERCRINRRDSSKQCSAILTFRTKDQAVSAIDRFDHKHFLGREIRVRADTQTFTVEETRSGNAESSSNPIARSPDEIRRPVIVDGSVDASGSECSSPSSATRKAKGFTEDEKVNRNRAIETKGPSSSKKRAKKVAKDEVEELGTRAGKMKISK